MNRKTEKYVVELMLQMDFNSSDVWNRTEKKTARESLMENNCKHVILCLHYLSFLSQPSIPEKYKKKKTENIYFPSNNKHPKHH